jgi:hypothetical protein
VAESTRIRDVKCVEEEMRVVLRWENLTSREERRRATHVIVYALLSFPLPGAPTPPAAVISTGYIA